MFFGVIRGKKKCVVLFFRPLPSLLPFLCGNRCPPGKEFGSRKEKKMIGASKYLFIFLPAEPLSYSLPVVVPLRTLGIVLLFVGTGVRASLIGTF